MSERARVVDGEVVASWVETHHDRQRFAQAWGARRRRPWIAGAFVLAALGVAQVLAASEPARVVPTLVLALVAIGMARQLGPTATAANVDEMPPRPMSLRTHGSGIVWSGEGWSDALQPGALAGVSWVGVGLSLNLHGGGMIGLPKRCFASRAEARKVREVLRRLKASGPKTSAPAGGPAGALTASWELDLDELGALMLPPGSPDAPGTGVTLVLTGVFWSLVGLVATSALELALPAIPLRTGFLLTVPAAVLFLGWVGRYSWFRTLLAQRFAARVPGALGPVFLGADAARVAWADALGAHEVSWPLVRKVVVVTQGEEVDGPVPDDARELAWVEVHTDFGRVGAVPLRALGEGGLAQLRAWGAGQ